MGWKLRLPVEIWIPAVIIGVAYLILATLTVIAFVRKLIGLLRRFRYSLPPLPQASATSADEHGPGSVKVSTTEQSKWAMVSTFEVNLPFAHELRAMREAEPLP